MDFELTDDEIASFQSGEYALWGDFKRAIAKAAQRKLVENLEQYWFIDRKPCKECNSVLSISKEDWQELRKGVGLE